MVEKLGIVYTPVEVVDFIIHSVNYVLEKEFDRKLSDENILTRLQARDVSSTYLESFNPKKRYLRKMQSEIHANEIVLLAYYIAAVNIENAFHDAIDAKEYLSLTGFV